MSTPIRDARKAARILGIEIPEEYANTKANGGVANRSGGKFYWEAKGQVPFQAEVSRAMWRLSAGSGGTTGKNGEGILKAEEFWALTGLTEGQVKVGEKHTVTLPNGKEVTFQRIE